MALYDRDINWRIDARRKPISWVDKNGCMECTSHYRNEKGYPMTGYKMRPMPVVKMLWLRKNGKIPRGLVMRHTCDNPRCINLKHIVLGTIAENMRDREVRGRTMHGEKISWRKLSAEDAILIANTPSGWKGVSCRVLAERFGVSKSAIKNIRSGKRWWRVTGVGA